MTAYLIFDGSNASGNSPVNCHIRGDIRQRRQHYAPFRARLAFAKEAVLPRQIFIIWLQINKVITAIVIRPLDDPTYVLNLWSPIYDSSV